MNCSVNTKIFVIPIKPTLVIIFCSVQTFSSTVHLRNQWRNFESVCIKDFESNTFWVLSSITVAQDGFVIEMLSSWCMIISCSDHSVNNRGLETNWCLVINWTNTFSQSVIELLKLKFLSYSRYQQSRVSYLVSYPWLIYQVICNDVLATLEIFSHFLPELCKLLV